MVSPWAGFCASCKCSPHMCRNAPHFPHCCGLVTVRTSLGWGHSGVTSRLPVPLSSLFSSHLRASQSRVGGGRTGFLVMNDGLGVRGIGCSSSEEDWCTPQSLLLWTRGWVFSIKWHPKLFSCVLLSYMCCFKSPIESLPVLFISGGFCYPCLFYITLV